MDALSRVDPGFETERVLAFRVSGNWSENYDDAERLVQRIDGTLDELTALPGIDSVATSWTLPGAPGPFQPEFQLIGAQAETESPLIAAWRTVSPSYFGTMGIALASGDVCRSLPAGIHRPGASMDLMVNRSFANRYFPGRDVTGLSLAWESGTLRGRVTGTVADARELGIGSAVVPTVYACDSAPSPFPWYLARTSGDTGAAAAAVRRKIGELEPLRSVYQIAPLDQLIGDAYAQTRLRTVLLTFFAATALLLAALGVYGTLSYVVGLRRREIGLRVALGARHANIVSQFLFKALRVVGVGCVAGLGLVFVFTRSLASMLYGVAPTDVTTLVAVLAVVTCIAAAAALIPAKRAARLDPMEALRFE
jgi:hypothetical protein